MRPDTITIKMQTMGWEMGCFSYFELMAEPNTRIKVDWGDNHSRDVLAGSGWLRLEHTYPQDDAEYTITIKSDGDGAILGLRNWSIDMTTLEIDISGSPSLRYLTAHHLAALDTTNNPQLLELDIESYKGESIDLSANTHLTALNCSLSSLTRLNLSKCDCLALLDCDMCSDLTAIGLSNNSRLREIVYSDATPLDSHSLKFINETIERNKY